MSRLIIDTTSRKKPVGKFCDCIDTVNKLLEEQNGEVLCSHLLKGGRIAIIELVKKDNKVRKKPGTMLATFCPFCGVKYPQ